MKITDEAVEAAKRRVDDAASINTIRAILEAAAPHMLAEAWDALPALPAESVIRDKFGTVLERQQEESGALVWLPVGSGEVWAEEDIDLPVTVLYRPNP